MAVAEGRSDRLVGVVHTIPCRACHNDARQASSADIGRRVVRSRSDRAAPDSAVGRASFSDGVDDGLGDTYRAAIMTTSTTIDPGGKRPDSTQTIVTRPALSALGSRRNSAAFQPPKRTAHSVDEHLEVWAQITVADDREVELSSV